VNHIGEDFQSDEDYDDDYEHKGNNSMYVGLI
jgi:hypothetical protein